MSAVCLLLRILQPTISNDAMDCDDGSRRSSSSLSSSDWEETEVPEEATIGLRREDDGEADDEQSDWPGPESGSVYGGFTDDEQDLDSSTPCSPSVTVSRFWFLNMPGCSSAAGCPNSRIGIEVSSFACPPKGKRGPMNVFSSTSPEVLSSSDELREFD